MRRRALVFAAFAVLPLGCFSLDGFSGGAVPADGGGAEASDGAITITDASATTEAAASGDGAVVSYPDAVLADSPSAYFRFEDPVGTTMVKDETGQHPGGTFGSGVTFGVPGAVGNGVQFAATGGIGLGDVFSFGDLNEFTIEFWMQNDAPMGDYESLVEKRSSAGGQPQNGWVIFMSRIDRHMQFQFWANAAVNEQGTTDNGPQGMHHVAVVRTASSQQLTLAMYFDGVLQTKNTNYGSTGAEPTTQNDLNIGYSWHGSIDELAFYERALSAERVSAHFQAKR